MKYPIALLAATLALSTTAWAEEHTHEHAHHAHDAKKAGAHKAGQKWKADQQLKTSMAKLQEGTAKVEKDAAFAPAFAKETREEVLTIIKNCKLAPEADAELHGVLAQINEGADALSKSDSKTGVKRMKQAFALYGERFE